MRNGFFTKWVSFVTLLTFIVSSMAPVYAQGLSLGTGAGVLPEPGTMVSLSQSFNPPILKGVKVYANNPLKFDFILDKGDNPTALSAESEKLIRYFLASLTVPEKDLWVNLSPYEKDRIIPDAFGQTEMGRDLLAEDYILKQITASALYPQDALGQGFWKKVYARAYEKYGTTDIPVDTFNKVWIVPAKAVVYERSGGSSGADKSAVAYVVESKLKVMLESDYLAQEKNVGAQFIEPGMHGSIEPGIPGAMNRTPTQEFIKEILREIVIPALETEVNTGKNFAPLRQVYNSLILAAWYKKKIKESLLTSVYVDQKKLQGVNVEDPAITQKIWAQYVEAFKKGAFNFIKEEQDELTNEMIPRKYFSGGMDFAQGLAAAVQFKTDAATLPLAASDRDMIVEADISTPDMAQSAILDAPNKAPKALRRARAVNIMDEADFDNFWKSILDKEIDQAPKSLAAELKKLRFEKGDGTPAEPVFNDTQAEAMSLKTDEIYERLLFLREMLEFRHADGWGLAASKAVDLSLSYPWGGESAVRREMKALSSPEALDTYLTTLASPTEEAGAASEQPSAVVWKEPGFSAEEERTFNDVLSKIKDIEGNLTALAGQLERITVNGQAISDKKAERLAKRVLGNGKVAYSKMMFFRDVLGWKKANSGKRFFTLIQALNIAMWPGEARLEEVRKELDVLLSSSLFGPGQITSMIIVKDFTAQYMEELLKTAQKMGINDGAKIYQLVLNTEKAREVPQLAAVLDEMDLRGTAARPQDITLQAEGSSVDISDPKSFDDFFATVWDENLELVASSFDGNGPQQASSVMRFIDLVRRDYGIEVKESQDPFVTLDNILTSATLYDQWRRDPDSVATTEILLLADLTREARSLPYAQLKAVEKENIRKLNHLVLEKAYPNRILRSPSIRGEKMLAYLMRLQFKGKNVFTATAAKRMASIKDVFGSLVFLKRAIEVKDLSGHDLFSTLSPLMHIVQSNLAGKQDEMINEIEQLTRITEDTPEGKRQFFDPNHIMLIVAKRKMPLNEKLQGIDELRKMKIFTPSQISLILFSSTPDAVAFARELNREEAGGRKILNGTQIVDIIHRNVFRDPQKRREYIEHLRSKISVIPEVLEARSLDIVEDELPDYWPKLSQVDPGAFASQLLRLKYGNETIFTEETAGKIVGRESAYQRVAFLRKLLAYQTSDQESVFSLQQASIMAADYPVRDEDVILERLEWLVGQERADGKPALTATDVRYVLNNPGLFSLEKFKMIWARLASTDVQARKILNYMLRPEKYRDFIKTWITGPMGEWPYLAARAKYVLVARSKISTEQVKFMMQVLFPDLSEDFNRYADRSVAEDRELVKTLDENTPAPDQVIKQLLTSFDNNVKETTLKFLLQWLKDKYLYMATSIGEKEGELVLNPDGADAFNARILQYDWARPEAGLENLKSNLRDIYFERSEYVHIQSLTPRLARLYRRAGVLQRIYLKNHPDRVPKAGRFSKPVIRRLLDSGYSNAEISAALFFRMPSMDAPTSGAGERKTTNLYSVKAAPEKKAYEISDGTSFEDDNGVTQVKIILPGNKVFWVYANSLQEAMALYLRDYPESREVWQAIGRGDGRYTVTFKNKKEEFVVSDLRDILTMDLDYNTMLIVADSSMAPEEKKGGIDFNSDRMNLEMRGDGNAVMKFNMDPGLMEKFKSAPGFVPVIINIYPLNNLQKFLGVNEDLKKGSVAWSAVKGVSKAA
ncbi:MAG: hypothetical protein HQL16_05120 [Candidatus Omnitrophica bacterium]|nr:hypothetical protein [Candidatus Omnitrophota bacterium]